MRVPELRLRRVGEGEAPRDDGEYVLYWMTAARRSRFNFALERAVSWAAELKKPLVILEALRCDYRWASDRIHQFVIQGMLDNQRAFRGSAALYLPFVEQEKGQGKGLLAALASKACVVVGDDFPCFFLPRMIDAAAAQVSCLFELVDGNGLLPMRAAEREFTTAYSFRRFLHKTLPPHLAEVPLPDPLADAELTTIENINGLDAWTMASEASLESWSRDTRDFPIDHSVKRTTKDGGSAAAQDCLGNFLANLEAYLGDRNHPEREATSGLSPYLHFGHVSVHEVFLRLAEQEGWSPERIASKPTGQRAGFWGMSEAAESFIDELVTWREIGYNSCHRRPDYDSLDSLPDWAQKTIREHRDDDREWSYSLEEFERGQTHDELWNAAQGQLVSEGIIHNYLRMLWGKKIYEWSATPEHALEVMVELNNKYALDGRNPNSYSGIFWVLGRYDRAWGPVRPIFGKLRYMSSDSTRRKTKVGEYIKKYGRSASQGRLL